MRLLIRNGDTNAFAGLQRAMSQGFSTPRASKNSFGGAGGRSAFLAESRGSQRRLPRCLFGQRYWHVHGHDAARRDRQQRHPRRGHPGGKGLARHHAARWLDRRRAPHQLRLCNSALLGTRQRHQFYLYPEPECRVRLDAHRALRPRHHDAGRDRRGDEVASWAHVRGISSRISEFPVGTSNSRRGVRRLALPSVTSRAITRSWRLPAMISPAWSTSSALSTTRGVTYVGKAWPTRVFSTLRVTEIVSPARVLHRATGARAQSSTSDS